MSKPAAAGIIAVAGVVTFLAIVIWLHIAQPGYDWANQLMSELALGAHGQLMLWAFLALALSLSALAIGFRATGGNLLLSVPLLISASFFVGAGVFPLGATTEVHVAAIGLAFVAVGFAMYALPYCAIRFQSTVWRSISWGLLALMALSVALGRSLIPNGAAQRLAAAALLAWVSLCALKIIRS